MTGGQPTSPEALPELELFGGLGSDDRRSLAALCAPVALAAGEDVFREGDVGRDLYVLAGGAARVSKTEQGQDQELAVIEPETVFGELSLVLGEPRSATVTAIKDSTLVRVDGARFLERQAAGDVPTLRLGWIILGKLAARQSAMNRDILQLSQAAQSGGVGQDDVSRLREKLLKEWSF